MLACHAAASEPGSGSKAVAEKIHAPALLGVWEDTRAIRQEPDGGPGAPWEHRVRACGRTGPDGAGAGLPGHQLHVKYDR